MYKIMNKRFLAKAFLSGIDKRKDNIIL